MRVSVSGELTVIIIQSLMEGGKISLAAHVYEGSLYGKATNWIGSTRYFFEDL